MSGYLHISQTIARPVDKVFATAGRCQSFASRWARSFFQMFRWFNQRGYRADVEGLRTRYPELGLRTLEDWLIEEGWEG